MKGLSAFCLTVLLNFLHKISTALATTSSKEFDDLIKGTRLQDEAYVRVYYCPDFNTVKIATKIQK